MLNFTPDGLQKYGNNFNENGFWDKIKKFAQKVGLEGIRNALRLWYALDNPEMPAKIKAVIYGALGYFITPIDMVPDFIPVAGFTDDIAALAAAIIIASTYIDQTAKNKAEQKLKDWFGDID